jgi:hypothetical protein
VEKKAHCLKFEFVKFEKSVKPQIVEEQSRQAMIVDSDLRAATQEKPKHKFFVFKNGKITKHTQSGHLPHLRLLIASYRTGWPRSSSSGYHQARSACNA